MATIMHSLFDVSQVRLQRGLPVSLVRQLESARPIAEVMA